MKKKQEKKSSKKEEQEREEQARAAQRAQQQRKQQLARQKEQYLQNRSSPLVEYGLIDAFEYFMVQLTQAGIPQGNLYEFAAQTILKYEKNLRKKARNKEEVEKFNEIVIKSSPTKQSPPQPSTNKLIKPQLTPFKKQLSQQEKLILGQINTKPLA